MGQVYVISDIHPEENVYTGMLTNIEHIKIGYTANDVDQRIAQLQTGNPRELQIVYEYFFDTPEMAKQAERMCHVKLREHKISGEWFRYNEDVFNTLKALEHLSEFLSHTCPDDESIREWEKEEFKKVIK